MKVAIIGIGYWGKKHVEEYNQLGHDIIICDNDEKNVSECKEKFPFVNLSVQCCTVGQNPFCLYA